MILRGYIKPSISFGSFWDIEMKQETWPFYSTPSMWEQKSMTKNKTHPPHPTRCGFGLLACAFWAKLWNEIHSAKMECSADEPNESIFPQVESYSSISCTCVCRIFVWSTKLCNLCHGYAVTGRQAAKHEVLCALVADPRWRISDTRHVKPWSLSLKV